jgi:hypothetical protein
MSGMKMRKEMLTGALLLVMAAGLVAGCTERVEENVDPDLEIRVLEVQAKDKSPAPNAKNASDGKEFLFVKINLTNDNDKADHTVWNADRFSVDDNSAKKVDGSYLANNDMREIETLIVDHGTGKTFWIVFEVEDDMKMKYLRYDAGLDEPIDNEIPDYDHFEGKV